MTEVLREKHEHFAATKIRLNKFRTKTLTKTIQTEKKQRLYNNGGLDEW